MPHRVATARWRPAGAWERVPRNVRTLLIKSFLLNVAIYVSSGLIPAFLREAGLDVVRIGLFFSVSTVAGFVAGVSGGFLADRVGRRRVVVASVVFHAVGTAFFIIARSWVGLIAVALLWGFGNLDRAASSAITADATHEGNRGSFYGLLLSAPPLAGIIAPIAGGLIADRWGSGPAIALSLPFFALAIWVALRLRDSKPVAPAPAAPIPTEEPSSPALVQTPTGRPRFSELWHFVAGRGSASAWAVMGMWLIAGIEMGLSRPLIALYLQDRFGADYATIALNATLQFAATAAVTLAGGFLADRIGRRGVILVTQFFSAALYTLQPLTGVIAVFFGLRTVTSGVINLAVPAWEAVTVEVAPTRLRASYTGLATSGFSVGMAIGGALAGLVYGLSPALLFHATAAMELSILVIAGFWAVPAKASPGESQAMRSKA